MLKLILPLFIMLLNPHWHVSCVTLSILTLFQMKYLYFFVSQLNPLSNIFMIDPMSISLILLSIWVSNLMFLASFNISSSEKKKNSFSILIIILLIILLLAFSINNFMFFYILFEASLIPTMLIIMGWGYQPERLQASMFLIMYTVTASLPLLAIITALFMKNYSLFTVFKQNFTILITTSIMMTTAFLVKMPMYLTHLWLPKAHVEAPVAGSMVLAGILLKLGSYGIIRLALMVPYFMSPLTSILIPISLWGAAVTAMICVRQHDMKSLIAYSSVSHMALTILGMISYFKWGWEGALMMMFAHGLSSSGLFFLANSSYEISNTRSVYLSKGLMSTAPIMSLWWFLMSVSNMGAPPSLNLLSEITLLSSISSMSLWSSIFTLTAMFLAAAYSLILYTSIHHGSSPNFALIISSSTFRNWMTALAHAFPLFSLFLCSCLFTSLLM